MAVRCRSARDLLDDVEEVRQLFRREGAALSGRLRVDMPTGLARHVVLPRLAQFLDAHPRLELELSSTDRRVDVVREGFDCVVRVGTLSDSSLVARRLGAFRVLNCASPGYVARFGVPRTPADLVSHRLIHYATRFGAPLDGFEYHDGSDVISVPMPGALIVNNADAYQAACLAGLGLIQAPATGLRELLASGALVELLPDYRAEPMPVHVLYAHRRQLPRRVQVFMHWLGEVVGAEIAAANADIDARSVS